MRTELILTFLIAFAVSTVIVSGQYYDDYGNFGNYDGRPMVPRQKKPLQTCIGIGDKCDFDHQCCQKKCASPTFWGHNKCSLTL